MGKRDKKGGPQKHKSADHRSAELATMAWMLTTITTLVCEVMTAASRAYVIWVDPEALKMGVLSGLLLFAALVMGMLALGLQLVVLRLRRTPPPRPILVFATVIAIAPLFSSLVIYLR